MIDDPDGDGCQEIVAGTSTGLSSNIYHGHIYVFNSSTLQLEWQSPDIGQVVKVLITDFDNNGIKEIVASVTHHMSDVIGDRYGYVYVFDGVTHQQVWKSGNVGQQSGDRGIVVTDLDGDGIKDIVISGMTYYSCTRTGYVYVFDGSDFTLRWQSQDLNSPGHIVIADLDDDGTKEIIVGKCVTDCAYSPSEGGYYYPGHIHIFDGRTFNQEWQSEDIGCAQNLTVNDLDGDGVKELIAGVARSSAPNSDPDRGYVYVFDGRAHVQEWRSPDIDHPYAVQIDDVDNDGAQEIIARSGMGHTSTPQTGHIHVFDAVTHNQEWQSDNLGYAYDLEVTDAENDGAKEILSRTKEGGTGHLVILDGVTHLQEWQSEDIGIGVGRPGLLAADVDDDGCKEIVAGASTQEYHGNLYIFDVGPAPSGDYIVKTGAEADSTQFSSQRKLVVTSEGRLHAAYHRKIGGISQIFHAESADGGRTWTEEQVTNATRDQDCPALAVDSLNNLHIVWQDSMYFQPSIVPNVLYRAKTTTWGDVEVVASYAQCPAIAVDSDDHIHVIYGPYVYSPGYYGGGDGKRWRERTPSGWGTEERFSQDQCWGPAQAIAIDGNDNVHVAFRHTPSSTYDTHYRSRSPSGWGTEIDVGVAGNLGGGGLEPSIAIDSTNNVHIVWAHRDSSSGNYYIKYRRFTTSWQPIVDLEGPTAYPQDTPTIAIDSRNDIHVVWSGKHSGSPTYYQIRHREYTTSWQPIQNLTSSSSNHQSSPSSMWANYPQIGGQRTNVPQDGYSFIWMDGVIIRYGSP